MATVRVVAITMCVTASARPSRGANSTARNSRNALRRLRASAIAAMVHLDRDGHARVHSLRRRMVEPNPDGEPPRDHDPVKITSDLGKSRTVLVASLHARAETFDSSCEGTIALGHSPDRRGVADGDPRQLGLTEVRDRIPGVGLDETEQRPARQGKCSFCDLQADHYS